MNTVDDDTMSPDDDEVENVHDLSRSRDSTDKSKSRKPHGPNKRTWAVNGKSEPMEFDKEGKAIGLRSKDLNKYIAEVGRDMKLDVPDFRLMPSGQIKWAWRCISVQDITQLPFVERELMLIKITVKTTARRDVLDIASIFRAKVVDVSDHTVTLEILITTLESLFHKMFLQEYL